jgi:L1 cell adhesion molecule like protein
MKGNMTGQNSAKSSEILGIDFGSSSSCIAIWQNNFVDVIPNEQNYRITPSYVAFTETDILLGEFAENQMTRNFANTIGGLKKIIGAKVNDFDIQQFLGKVDYKWEEDEKGDISIVVHPGVNQVFKLSAQTVAGYLFAMLKTNAETFLKRKVSDVVISVPSSFTYHQREMLKEAARTGGLNCVKLLPESVAIVMAYSVTKLSQSDKTQKKMLTIDFGASKVEMSIISAEDQIYHVLGTVSDKNCGGQDLDNLLIDYCAYDFLTKTGTDITTNTKAMKKLKVSCEKAKKMLSINSETSMEIDCLDGKNDYIVVLKRSLFDILTKPLLFKIISLIDKLLKNCALNKDSIKDIILAGGSSRIPRFYQVVKEYFNNSKEPNKSLNADEAVAQGCAIQGALLSGKYQDMLPFLCTSTSYGIQVADGSMTVLMPRNTCYPTKALSSFTTSSDDQKKIVFQIYEGESVLCSDNHYIFGFEVEIKQKNKLVQQIKGIAGSGNKAPWFNLSLDVDGDGNITVILTDEDGAARAYSYHSPDKLKYTKVQLTRDLPMPYKRN